jgi:hypothetical protein
VNSKFLLTGLLATSLILSGLVFAGGGGNGGGTPTTPPKFSISSSYADVYSSDASGCTNLGKLRWILAGRAATVANRAARYIAADVTLWAGGIYRTRPDKLTERTGPLTYINTPDVTYSLTCTLILNTAYETESKGWHKAIAQSNDPNPGIGNITITTSDKIRL